MLDVEDDGFATVYPRVATVRSTPEPAVAVVDEDLLRYSEVWRNPYANDGSWSVAWRLPWN